MLPTSEIVVHGVRSAVYDAGDPQSSEAVVLVHGNPGPLDDWEDIAPALTGFARVIAMDMPGYGRAEHWPARFDFSVAGYSRYLDGVLVQRGVERAHLVLHDFGGAWGARWALDHPARVASITLINAPLCGEFRWHLFARVWQTPWFGELLQRASGPRSIRYVMNRDNPRPLPEPFLARVLSYADWDQKRAVLELYRASKSEQQTFGVLAEGLRALDPAACLIWGAADRYTPAKYAEIQRRLFTRAELHLLEGLGHWPFVDDPAQVRELLVRFLRRQLGATSHAHTA